MTGYEPHFTLKPMGEGIWIADGPAIRFVGVPFPTRMTLVRLPDGGLWVHSPIALDAGLRAEVDALGPVRHLVSPNWIHYAFIGEWQRVYPGAVAWASPGVRARAAKTRAEIRFDRDLGDAAPEDWAGAIRQRIVRGSFLHEEVAFFHDASRVLILADLIENFETRHMPWWFSALGRLDGVMAPDGKLPGELRLTFRRREVTRPIVEEIIGWAPQRVIVAHGACIETEAPARLRRAFGWALR